MEIVAHVVEDAFAILDPAHFAGDLVLGSGEEELFEDGGDAGFGGEANAATVPCGGAAAEDERVEAGLSDETGGDFLIERDAVLDVVWADEIGVHAGEECHFGVMT